MAQGSLIYLAVSHLVGPWLYQEGRGFWVLHLLSPSPGQVGLPRAGSHGKGLPMNLGPGLHPQVVSLWASQILH